MEQKKKIHRHNWLMEIGAGIYATAYAFMLLYISGDGIPFILGYISMYMMYKTIARKKIDKELLYVSTISILVSLIVALIIYIIYK